jgi:hypothetical protein
MPQKVSDILASKDFWDVSKPAQIIFLRKRFSDQFSDVSDDAIGQWLEKRRPPKPPTFQQRLLEPLTTAKSFGEAARNIGETAKMTGKALWGDEPSATRLVAGAQEFGKEAGKGLLTSVSNIGAYTAPGLAEYGIKKAAGIPVPPLPKPLDVARPIAAGEVAQGIEDARKGYYRGAAGSFTAAVAELLPWVGRKPFMRMATRAAAPFRAVAEGATLASGEKFPMTVGTALPESVAAKAEAISGQLIGGSRIRNVRQAQHMAANTIVNRVAETAAREAGATGFVRMENPADTFDLAGRTLMQNEAGPLFRELDAAMNSPKAVQPIADSAIRAAQKELNRVSNQQLLSRPDIGSVLRSNLEALAGSPLRGGVAIQGGGVFQIFRDTLSTLKELQRTLRKQKDLNGVRLTGEMIERLTEATEAGLNKTDPQLVTKFRRANVLYAQGAALKEFAERLREHIQGTPSGVQRIAGVATRAQQLKGAGVIEMLQDMNQEGSLYRAVPAAVDAKTLMQVAELLDRAQTSGGIAAKFGILAAIRAAGYGVPAIVGFGSPAAGLTFLTHEALGAYVVSFAMASPKGARLLASFLEAAPNSAAEAQLASRLTTLAFGKDAKLPPDKKKPEKAAAPTPPPAATTRPTPPPTPASTPPGLTPADLEFLRRHGLSVQ